MPITVRKLSDQEAASTFPRGSNINLGEYVEALRGLRPGDAAEALRGNLTSRTFKRRLTLAAKHLGLALRYAKEAGEEAVRFQVRQPRAGTTPALPAGQRRRGRPPKNPAPSA